MDNTKNIDTAKYKPINTIPSLENTLISMGLDLNLESNLISWLHQLKYTWKTWKRNPIVETHIDALFHSRQDSFKIALLFVINCEDLKDCKPKTLPYFIIEVLLKYSQASKVVPDESLKLPAYNISIYQRNQNFLNLMVKTYQLNTIKDTIVPNVREMLLNDNCKQASQIVISMELFDDIPVEDLLFPLILQDKTNMIDDYLSQCPTQVIPFLLYLDKLLDKNFKLLDFVQVYAEKHNVYHIKSHKLHYKPLGKFVARLCNKFNIPVETCKTLSKNRMTSGLRYLVYQKYVEHNVSNTVWEDLVKDSLRQSQESAYEFIDLLISYDKYEALKWVKHLNIPEDSLPPALKTTNFQREPEAENWDTDVKDIPKEFYESSLSTDQIEIIDTGEKFYDLLISSLVNYSIVSLDCEWKPSFGAKQSQVALIQLGTIDKVYIIDTIILNKPEYTSFWHTFCKTFLDNAETIKLGFGLEQDLREMKSIVALNNIKLKGEGFLDLSLLWKCLINHGLCLPGGSDSGAGLSSLVQSCFGKPLEKSEQCSNWELRPLRDTQIKYAAVDAHVLIQIYYYLEKKCKEQGINFEEISNSVMVQSRKKSINKPKVIDRIHQSLLPVYEAKSATDIKFLVDSGLLNIIPYLRYCGVDTVVMPSTMLWHDVIYQAISDERFVILPKPKNTPNSKFPQSSILCVGKCPLLEQLYKIINTYNVDIQPANILSLCVFCNSNDIKKLNPNEIKRICKKNRTCSVASQKCTKYLPDCDEDEIDFGGFLSDSECDDVKYGQHTEPVYQKSFTSKGIEIIVNDMSKLSMTQKPTFLCEDCGKLYSEDDDYLINLRETVMKVAKLKQPT